MTRSGRPTRVELVYRQLRADILAGRQAPGARLPFADLLTRYGASMGVVREALSRLTAEGLVESEAQHGFRVIPISAVDLRHLTAARCAIETLVLREAMQHGGVEWESRVLAAHHRLAAMMLTAVDDPARLTDEWAAAHATFHSALLDGCPNPRLRAVAASLRDSAELYRRWSVPLGHENRDIAHEHRGILAAVLAHDVDSAVALLHEHIQHTTRVLLCDAEAEVEAKTNTAATA